MKVADVGSGYGFFAFPAAEMVGDEGVVYAVEPNVQRAAEISKMIAKRDVKNLKVLEAGLRTSEGYPRRGSTSRCPCRPSTISPTRKGDLLSLEGS